MNQRALLELLEALNAADVDDRIRAAAATIYQALIEVELTSVIGAGPHERSETRLAQHIGHRPRVLSTTAGDSEVRVGHWRGWLAGGGDASSCHVAEVRPQREVDVRKIIEQRGYVGLVQHRELVA